MHREHISDLASAIVAVQQTAYLIIRTGRDGHRKDTEMFGYVTKLAKTLRGPSIEEREMAYLNQSVDRVDLEFRQRQVERGMFRRNQQNFY
jgi:hypothetical protein